MLGFLSCLDQLAAPRVWPLTSRGHSYSPWPSFRDGFHPFLPSLSGVHFRVVVDTA